MNIGNLRGRTANRIGFQAGRLSVALGGTLGARAYQRFAAKVQGDALFEPTRKRLEKHYQGRVFRPRADKPYTLKGLKEQLVELLGKEPQPQEILKLLTEHGGIHSGGPSADHLGNALGELYPHLEQMVEDWVAKTFWKETFYTVGSPHEEGNKGKIEKMKDAVESWAEKQHGEEHYLRVRKLMSDAQRVLEAGCYTAEHLIRWAAENPSGQAYGLDLCPEALLAAQKKSPENLRLVRGDIRRMPFPDNSFDVTSNSGVLEHFREEQRNAVFREMVRVTRRGGKVIASVPNLHSPSVRYRAAIQDFDINPADVGEKKAYKNWGLRYEQPLRPEELRKLFEQSGLINIIQSGWNPLRDLKTGSWVWDYLNKGALFWYDRWRKPIHPFSLQLLAILIDGLFIKPVDKLTHSWISANFGDQFVFAGIKP